jgi:hypothetical protein
VDLSDALLGLFGMVSHWYLRARGFGVLLCLPIAITTLADWRVRGRR